MKPFDYYEPTSIEEACSLFTELGSATSFLAGGTDLVVRMKRGICEPAGVINLKTIPGFNKITLEGEHIRIGALTCLADLATSPLIRAKLPALALGADSVGTPQIRNLATLGGNLCNASPCADTAPALLVSEASLQISGQKGTRQEPIASFFLAPGKTTLSAGEIVTAIIVPVPSLLTVQTFIKLGPRKSGDISVVNTAVSLSFDGGRCARARIALGSVAPTPLRARETEAWIEGQEASSIDAAEAGRRAAEEVRPISDLRGSQEYRKEMVSVLTERALSSLLQNL